VTYSSVHPWQSVVDRSLPLHALLHVACPWWKPIAKQSSFHHAHLAQMDYNWTTLATYHHLTLSYSITRPQQCCQAYNENIDDPMGLKRVWLKISSRKLMCIKAVCFFSHYYFLGLCHRDCRWHLSLPWLSEGESSVMVSSPSQTVCPHKGH
jgi:hypothetical protein